MFVYRAQPIDRADEAPGVDWRVVGSEIDVALRSAGHIVFRPDRAFAVGPDAPIDYRLEAINREALARADVLIALLPPGVPTLGTGREIEVARMLGKPVAVVADGRLWSAADCQRFPFSTAAAPEIAEWVGKQETALGGSPLLFIQDAPEHRATLPTRNYGGDAAFDLYVAERTVVGHDSFVDVPCGVRVALPPGVWARITGRSSTLRKKGLLVAEGVIDQGYRGPLFAGVRNLSPTRVVLEPGERVAQLILHELVAHRFFATWASHEEFSAVPGDGRGERGFGSTGE